MSFADLKRLAEAATPGPWWIDSHGHAMVSHSDGEHCLALIFQADDRMGPAVHHEYTGNLSHWRNDADASYIAAANPKAILELIDRLTQAIELAVQYGGIDGAHHKSWVIDQMVRTLAGDQYETVVAEAKAGEDGPDTYDWDEGVAP